MNVALRPEPLNILSICTGGGGLDLGVELAIPDARTVCMVEREAFACAQLVSAMEAGLMAPAPIWSDARSFDGRAWRGAVDGLIGGIPCQPHSLAGKRLGEEDERDLWSTARRIIVQSGAWFVVIENVRGILSSGGAERVWRDLRRLGFQVEGGLFTAAEVGASHERERFFILAILDDASGRRERRVCRSIPSAADADGPIRAHGSEWHPEHSGEGIPGVGQADAYCERLEGQRTDDGALGWQDAGRSAGLCNRATLDNAVSVGWEQGRNDHRKHERNELGSAGEHALVNPTSFGRGEGWAEPELRSWRGATPGSNGAMAYANSVEPSSVRGDLGKVRSLSEAKREPRHGASLPGGGCYTSLFPPGPNELGVWREILSRSPELEPAFRRVADGLAAGVDLAQCWSRVDRLRELGNGVVSLEAAYALRTLVTRLAARGSAGAARLVRMMEAAE